MRRGKEKGLTVELVAALLLSVLLVLWVLSLPAWPSVDSPVHLYYARVLRELIGHTGQPPTLFFAVKHWLPPYALYYYALLLLTRVLSPLAADKAMVCVYLVLLLGGVHRLARALAGANRRAADQVLLLSTLLALNWPLGMGFLNYCLSLVLALWALAVWFGRRGDAGLGWVVRFVALALLLTLAHPVPLLLVLGICGADWLRVWWAGEGREPLAQKASAWAGAALCLLYVFAFTDRHPLAQRTVAQESVVGRALHGYAGYLAGRDVGVLFGHGLAVEVYRAALPLTLLLALGLGLRGAVPRWRRREFAAADLFLLAATGLLLVLPWMPSDFSGAYFFPERLKLVVWVFALLGMARPGFVDGGSRAMNWLLVAGEVIAVGALLVAADVALRPIARQAVVWQNAGLVHRGERVLVLESAEVPDAPPVAPSWTPHYWMAVHGIRSADAVLVNAPWLDSAILPLERTGAMPEVPVPAQVMNAPSRLAEEMRADPALRARVLAGVDAVVFSRAERERGVPALLGAGWRCAVTADGGERVCRRGR